MIGAWVTRDGQAAAVDRKGLISGNVLVGRIDGRTVCWNAEGRHRWDRVEHPLDLVDRKAT